ncbi:MAG: rhodanese-like domain-containing protein [Pseudomonadota bacterium]
MKHSIIALAFAAALGTQAFVPAVAGEVDPAKVQEQKQSDLRLYLSAREAHDLKAADGKVLLVDVRTPEEVQYVGNADKMMDANIPYVLNDISAYDDKLKHYKNMANSNFTVAMEELLEKKGLNKDSAIILMCRSGDRSAKAASLLAKAGYTKVYSVVDGFEGDKAKDGENKGKRTVNGWKNANLPWSYHMDKDKMYYVLN